MGLLQESAVRNSSGGRANGGTKSLSETTKHSRIQSVDLPCCPCPPPLPTAILFAYSFSMILPEIQVRLLAFHLGLTQPERTHRCAQGRTAKLRGHRPSHAAAPCRVVPASCAGTAVAAWAELKTRTPPAVTYGLQDTIKGSVRGGPVRAMKKTVNWSVSIMTVFYLAVAISGYMAYGNDVAGKREPAGSRRGAAACAPCTLSLQLPRPRRILCVYVRRLSICPQPWSDSRWCCRQHPGLLPDPSVAGRHGQHHGLCPPAPRL